MNSSQESQSTKPWEEDLGDFLRSVETLEELNEFANTISVGREIDFRNKAWGHSFDPCDKIGEFLRGGWGFCQDKVKQGDVLIMNLQGGKVGKLSVLKVEYDKEKGSKDMFYAYVALSGYVEN